MRYTPSYGRLSTCFFFSSRRRHTRCSRDWSSDVCSSDLPFTIPIAISVLGWKWMFDSQFSVLNWALSGLGLIGEYGTPDWPVWLGQPMLAPASVMFVNVWRSFPFSAIVLLAGGDPAGPPDIHAAQAGRGAPLSTLPDKNR